MLSTVENCGQKTVSVHCAAAQVRVWLWASTSALFVATRGRADRGLAAGWAAPKLTYSEDAPSFEWTVFGGIVEFQNPGSRDCCHRPMPIMLQIDDNTRHVDLAGPEITDNDPSAIRDAICG